MEIYISDNKRSDCEYSKNLALCLEEKGRRVRHICIETVTSDLLLSEWKCDYFIATGMLYDIINTKVL
jgi:hypothetical protein